MQIIFTRNCTYTCMGTKQVIQIGTLFFVRTHKHPYTPCMHIAYNICTFTHMNRINMQVLREQYR
jgi:hypothetical protein